MLYLPAGCAHWGIARGADCITVSIGFRAPSHRDLLLGAAEHLAAQLPDNLRYRDTEQSIDDDRYLINDHALEQALEAWPEPASAATRDALMQTLGIQSTEPRNPEYIEAETSWSAAAIEELLSSVDELRIEHHRASRCAWQFNSNDAESTALLFVNGEPHATTVEFARGLCHGQLATADLGDARERQILLALLNAGSISIHS
jgi:50S ribosomal protein L16 3-hydroxylase